MRVGIMGGTFNPPHVGHINAAKAAARELLLDKLIFIPAGMPPHKDIAGSDPGPIARLHMTELAAREAGGEVSDIEIRRGGRSYTADTLSELLRLYPGAELWLIVGTDMFLSIETWRRPREIFASASLAVVAREPGERETLSLHAERLTREYGARSRIIDTDAVTISSTALRAGIRDPKFKLYLPGPVYDYIVKNGLYGVREEELT